MKIGLIVALVLCAGLLLSNASTDLEEDHVRIAHRGAKFEDVRASIERHPLDYYGYARAAELLWRRGDARAIRILNHSMRLHPTHPGLHRIAAHMLFRQGYIEQATIEYAAAIRATARPDKLIREVVAMFPAELAARAIPADLPDLRFVIASLDEVARPDVVISWLSRVLDGRRNDARLCELLHERLLRTGDVRTIELATQKCGDIVPDAHTRFAMARVMLAAANYDEVIRLLSDVESWTGRVDDKTSAWLLLCDAHTAQQQLDQAKRCLRRLDASGTVLPERAHEISERLEALAVVRQVEVPVVPSDAGVAGEPVLDAGH